MSAVLSLYPNARGLGYACVELPQELLDFGIVTVRPINNGRVMERVKTFIDYYKPAIVMVRDPESTNRRVVRLTEEIEAYAVRENIAVHKYTRHQIREAFETFGATTKYEISHRIVEWFPRLAIRAPKVRKAWMDEDYNMGIFDAVSLVVTHLHLMK